ncbi:MAG: helicase HerA domain-containing protein [Anaerolineales bacterium]
MLETSGKFFIGRTIEPSEPLFYDPEDLTTHAMVVGMTGSGKTGLCIDLLEEAALQGIPSMMIDPKGDITNLLLHFPDLLPADFLPWVNPDEARREGISLEDAAAQTATTWKNGLAGWDIMPERIQALSNAAQFTIFTPGSDAGIPVSILANLKAPEIAWEDNKELLREKISSTVTAILGLVGLNDIDPVRSREHILLSNIFERSWKTGTDLTLAELILQTQNPPFDKLGVFDISTFFPDKDRFELAMLLNNILAAPSFQTWIEGQPLNIDEMLYAPDGRPRHSVFYIAHLTDEERMFFVTLLYGAVETWMRAQSGSTSLRAILYFDEIFGFMPPVANPPSKQIMLRMLKQARAFGVGQVLVTQNPADLDYKALSNTGTWFVGKLQTENDKNRLLDGLQGSSPGLDRGHYDDVIAHLDKREFLCHNVHEKEPRVFKTRWAMNYLAGPLTRTQIPALNQLAGSAAMPEVSPVSFVDEQSGMEFVPIPTVDAQPEAAPAASLQPAIGSVTRPPVPSGYDEYFLPNNLTLSQAAAAVNRSLPVDARLLGLLYRPVLLAQAEVRFIKRNYNLDLDKTETALVIEADRRGSVRWEDWLVEGIDSKSLARGPAPQSVFSSLEAPLSDGSVLRSLRTDFVDWVYRNVEVSVRANEKLKIYAGPEVSQSEFRRMCADAARQVRDDEIDKVKDSYEKKLDRIEDRLHREERELKEDEADLAQRRLEEYGTHAENVLALFSKRSRRISTSLTKRRMTEKAKADVEESEDAIEDFKEQIADLEKELNGAIEEVQAKWAEIADDMEEIPVNPYKKDILIDLFGVAWFPYHLVEVDGRTVELPGFGNE